MSTTATAPAAPPPAETAPGAYTRVAQALHWVIAFLILGNLIGGLAMHKLPDTVSFKIQAYQMHKSFGLVILALSLFRLGWRLTHRAPPLPGHLAAWERVLARATHVAFYVLIVAVPLAGWLMISASPYPSSFFFLFPIPKLPVVGGVGFWTDVHEYLALAIVGLLALHIGGALKHHYKDRDGTLARMVPGMEKAR